ncbi:MAG: hypothetical protein ABH827_05740 [bacterium]
MSNSKSQLRSKTIIRVLVALFIAIVIGRAIFRFFLDQSAGEKESGRLVSLRVQTAAKEADVFFVQDGASFDFRKMIQLVDACSRVKRETALHFEGNVLMPGKAIDRDEVDSLLRELLREREKLKEYIWDLKGYSQTGMSMKKYRSLLYYTEVLENRIVEMRDLLARKK